MFGDGANRGPDFTAEALHLVSNYMNDYYQSKLASDGNGELLKKGVPEQVKTEIKTNRYSRENNSVALTDAQSYAADELIKYYNQKFTNPSLRYSSTCAAISSAVWSY